MGEESLRRNEQTSFFLIAIANVLPAVGYFLLDLSATAVVLLYWLEAVTVILFYGSLAMFAAPDRRVEERRDDRTAIRFLPQIYPENLRSAGSRTIVGLLIATAAAGSRTVPGMGSRGGSGGDVTDFFAQFTVFETPSVLAIGLILVGTQLVTLSRCYFGTGRYRELTASAVLDIQTKYYGLYLYFFVGFVLYAVASAIVIVVVLPAVVPGLSAWAAWKGWIAVSFLVLKLAFERSRVRGERRPGLDDDSFTSNFSPSPPPEERTENTT